MGDLIAMRYPTELFANLADHTYVTCGSKAWSCWGGKSGGTELRRGTGSTIRADEIAGANERAGITCYLINGVCHQAANRILLPAGITVRGARGYEVSEALFGPSGRAGATVELRKAPFDQPTGTTGDLSASTPMAMKMAARRAGKRRSPRAPRRGKRATPPGERKYLQGVLAIYGKTRAPFASAK